MAGSPASTHAAAPTGGIGGDGVQLVPVLPTNNTTNPLTPSNLAQQQPAQPTLDGPFDADQSPVQTTPAIPITGTAAQKLPWNAHKPIYFEPAALAPKSSIPPLMLALPGEIEAAEGYLELVSSGASLFGVRPKFRKMFARKALGLLLQVGECWHNPRHEARRQLAIGQAYRLLRQYDLAAQAFRKAASYRAFRAGAMASAGMCEKKMGRLAEAITSLTRALSVDPDVARYHFQLARCLCLAGQGSAALFELGFAIHLDSELGRRAFQCADFDSLRTSPAFRSLIERGVHFV